MGWNFEQIWLTKRGAPGFTSIGIIWLKAVLLAGGLGTRISEESQFRPKPMIEIGGMPILWHIMKCYSHYGIHDFIVCLGYKGYLIKEFFANYSLHTSDVTIQLNANRIDVLQRRAEPWTVTLIDTGLTTMTGGRLKRIADYLDGETFCLTYGDGLADINIDELIEFHRRQDKLATVTAVRPPGRYGALSMSDDDTTVLGFLEKPQGDGGRINGGFFVLSPKVIDLIDGDETSFEVEPMQKLVAQAQLAAFEHDGFWQPMDTLREKNLLETLINQGQAPWMVWQRSNKFS